MSRKKAIEELRADAGNALNRAYALASDTTTDAAALRNAVFGLCAFLRMTLAVLKLKVS